MSKEIYLEMCEDFEAMEKQRDNARKETAREILQELWCCREYLFNDGWAGCDIVINIDKVKQLAEKYGVEVE